MFRERFASPLFLWSKTMNRKLNKFLSAVDNFTAKSGGVVVFGVFPLIYIVSHEVIARYVFNSPTIWAHQSLEMTFGCYLVLLGAYCLQQKRHVRVDVLWEKLSLRGRAKADVLTGILSMGFIGSLFVFATLEAINSVMVDEHSYSVWGPPLWPPKIALAVASFMLLLQLGVKFIRDLSVGFGRVTVNHTSVEVKRNG